MSAKPPTLPLAKAVHTDPKSAPCAETTPLPEAVARKAVADKSPSEWAYERVILYLKTFEEQLDADHEVAMAFVGGDAGVIRIEGVGHFAPDLITFYGSDAAGLKTQLVQHVSQLNMMLRAMPKPVDAPEPNRIGFRLAAALDDSEA